MLKTINNDELCVPFDGFYIRHLTNCLFRFFFFFYLNNSIFIEKSNDDDDDLDRHFQPIYKAHALHNFHAQSNRYDPLMII